jgi:hypothetical protein
MEIEAFEPLERVQLNVALKTISDTTVISGWTEEVKFPVSLQPGKQAFECRFREVYLRPGHRLQVMLWMEADSVLDAVHDALIIDVCDGKNSETISTHKYLGVVTCPYSWSRLTDFDS